MRQQTTLPSDRHESDQFASGSDGRLEADAKYDRNNDIDLVIFFHSADLEQDAESMNLAEISRLCDMYNIPLATNIATAESLVLCLDRGDMEWRDYK